MANLIVYLILDAAPADATRAEWSKIARLALKGYSTRYAMDATVDERALQLAMCARLVVSLIYGLRTVRLNVRGDDPAYVLKTQSRGWATLKVSGCSFGEKSISKTFRRSLIAVNRRFCQSSRVQLEF